MMKQQTEPQSESKRLLSYPSDATSSLPPEPLKWLMKWGISFAQAQKHKFQWSDHLNPLGKSMLIFPVYVQDELVMWQGRTFPEGSTPKYYTEGAVEDIVYILHSKKECDTIVVTEDIISSIRVSDFCDAVPLFGSNLHPRKMQALADRYERLLLWLDRDKAKESIKYKTKYQGFFPKGVNVILTERDPKAYYDNEIEMYLDIYRKGYRAMMKKQ